MDLAALLLFCAVLLIVLIGTLYPMIYGLLGWGRLSVGAPYFNRATLPFGLLMLVVIVTAMVRSRKRAVHRQLPALLAHAGVLVYETAQIAVDLRFFKFVPGEHDALQWIWPI